MGVWQRIGKLLCISPSAGRLYISKRNFCKTHEGDVEIQDRETENPPSQGRATFFSSGVGCGGRFFSGGGFGGGGECLRGSRSGRDCMLRGGGWISYIDNIDRQATGSSA